MIEGVGVVRQEPVKHESSALDYPVGWIAQGPLQSPVKSRQVVREPRPGGHPESGGRLDADRPQPVSQRQVSKAVGRESVEIVRLVVQAPDVRGRQNEMSANAENSG